MCWITNSSWSFIIFSIRLLTDWRTDPRWLVFHLRHMLSRFDCLAHLTARGLDSVYAHSCLSRDRKHSNVSYSFLVRQIRLLHIRQDLFQPIYFTLFWWGFVCVLVTLVSSRRVGFHQVRRSITISKRSVLLLNATFVTYRLSFQMRSSGRRSRRHGQTISLSIMKCYTRTDVSKLYLSRLITHLVNLSQPKVERSLEEKQKEYYESLIVYIP